MGIHERLDRVCMRGGLVLALLLIGVETTVAQEGVGPCAAPGVAPASCAPCAGPISSTLGTFEPTPYITVRGNWPIGGGYSPLDLYGDQSMTLYGPLSPLRATSAPVTTYSRGYDGRINATPAVSFSTPNLPGLSPVIYPTPRSYFYGPRVNRTPPWWSSGANWIDQQ